MHHFHEKMSKNPSVSVCFRNYKELSRDKNGSDNRPSKPPSLMRLKSGTNGHEEIAEFVEKKFGSDKSVVFYVLEQISESFKAGNITYKEKTRLKKLLLNDKKGLVTVMSESVTFDKWKRDCVLCDKKIESGLKGIWCETQSHFTCAACLDKWVGQFTFESLTTARAEGFNFQDLFVRRGHIGLSRTV